LFTASRRTLGLDGDFERAIVHAAHVVVKRLGGLRRWTALDRADGALDASDTERSWRITPDLDSWTCADRHSISRRAAP
jgi:hypothetical protein